MIAALSPTPADIEFRRGITLDAFHDDRSLKYHARELNRARLAQTERITKGNA